MLNTSRVIVILLTVASGALGAAVPHASGGTPTTCDLDILSPTYCTGSKPSTEEKDKGRWLCEDERLGPKYLDLPAPLDALMLGYDRLGGLCPEKFFQTWFFPNGTIRWPGDDGFAVRSGKAQKSVITLPKGLRIDRFGSERGRFVAPAGTPYALRSIAPSNLVVKDAEKATAAPFNYYEYELLKDIDEVEAGPVQPWFGQIGWGTQYNLPKKINMLINEGALRRVEMVEMPPSLVVQAV